MTPESESKPANQNPLLQDQTSEPQAAPETGKTITESARENFAWLRKGQWLLFAAVLCFLAVFHHPERGWNVNTRLALVVAVVEARTFSIDGLHENDSPWFTNDKALYEGRFYSDKIFGVSLLALPVYWFQYNITNAVTGSPPGEEQINFLLTFFAVKIPAAFSLSLLWFLFVRLGVPPRRALLAVVGCFTGSMWLGYGTIFIPYIPGIAACLWALRIVLYPNTHRITTANTIAVGLLLGFAMICDLIFGLITVAIGIIWLLRLADQAGFYGMRAFADMQGDRTTGKQAVTLFSIIIGSGLVFPMLFAIYSTSIFGSPTIPYEYEYLEEFRVAMSQGFMGVTTPKLTAAWYLTIHPFRGVFFWSPWILLALAGGVMGTQSTGRLRIISWLSLFGFVAYLIFNSGYYMWWGGFGMGPRLMLPMFVFVPLGLVSLLRREVHRAWYIAILGALAWGVILNLPVSYLEPQTPSMPSQVIEAASISDGLPVNQLVYWRGFWPAMIDSATGATYEDGSRVPMYYFWRFFLGGAISLALLIALWRMLPEKVLPFERIEVPFINFDGNTAPLPR